MNQVVWRGGRAWGQWLSEGWDCQGWCSDDPKGPSCRPVCQHPSAAASLPRNMFPANLVEATFKQVSGRERQVAGPAWVTLGSSNCPSQLPVSGWRYPEETKAEDTRGPGSSQPPWLHLPPHSQVPVICEESLWGVEKLWEVLPSSLLPW